MNFRDSEQPVIPHRLSLSLQSLKSLLGLIRVRQWTKNTICFAGILFTNRLHEWNSVLLVGCAFAVFCLISSAVYILNDLVDRERDRQHPTKRDRPIASGAVGIPLAIVMGIGFVVSGLAGGYILGLPTLLCLLLYLANNVVYSFYTKHFALLNVFAIACGFVLRLMAGVYVLNDIPTAWGVLCAFFLAIFLGFAKRRAELVSLTEDESSQRPVLSLYTVPYLDYLVDSSATMVVVFYALFTVLSDKNPSLMLTIPIVYYAVMHYKRLIVMDNLGEEPDRILLRDRYMQLSIALWLMTYFAILSLDLRFVQ